MSKGNPLPPAAPGQQCQCTSHDPELPPASLARVFYDGPNDKLCYEWWCLNCVEADELPACEEAWPRDRWGKPQPRDRKGRIRTPVHCEVTPYD